MGEKRNLKQGGVGGSGTGSLPSNRLLLLAVASMVMSQVFWLLDVEASHKMLRGWLVSKRPQATISVITPYYNAHDQVMRQFERWQAWPEDLKDQIEVVVVDDGSPVQPLRVAVQKAHSTGLMQNAPRLLFLELLKDVGFNHGGAVNTGALHARGKYVLFLDADHWFDEDHWHRVLNFTTRIKPEDQDAFLEQFDRIDSVWVDRIIEGLDILYGPGSTAKKNFVESYMQGSPNTCMMSRTLFWNAGGFDEDLAGLYGNSDISFQTCVKHEFHVNKHPYGINHGAGIWAWYEGDGGTSGFSRSVRESKRLIRAKQARSRWCHDGPAARVPYAVIDETAWEGKDPVVPTPNAEHPRLDRKYAAALAAQGDANVEVGTPSGS